jgi:hypothetical protein
MAIEIVAIENAECDRRRYKREARTECASALVDAEHSRRQSSMRRGVADPETWIGPAAQDSVS